MVEQPQHAAWPKACACGATWRTSAWLGLVYVGVMDDGVDRIELRHCTCGSTIAMLVSDVRAASADFEPDVGSHRRRAR